MKLADMPVMPCKRIEAFKTGSGFPVNKNQEGYEAEVSYPGITVRQDFAARAMQGILANDADYLTDRKGWADDLAKVSLEAADALIEKLEEGK